MITYLLSLCVEGYGPTQIAKLLTERKILCPTAYAVSKGLKQISCMLDWRFPPARICGFTAQEYSVFSFYKWLYAFIAALRLAQADALYHGNRLYQIAEMTSGSKTSANINTIFCICFIFSAAAFVYGTFLLSPDIYIFEKTEQQWMGFLQVSICIIFMIIYFSILSLLQIIDLKRENRTMRLLFHMGKNQSDLKYLICTQVLIKLFMPMLMSFIILWTAAPFVNYKMNSILPIHNHLFKAFGGFMVCFFVLYLCYFGVVYIANMRYIKFSAK